MIEVGLDDIRKAAARIRSSVRVTPVMTCTAFDELAGVNLFFKCENLQRTGSFKLRGASNAVAQLSERQLSKGVATHSSGNHGAALALAARNRGAQATIVVPRGTPRIKRSALEGFGATVVECEPTMQARLETVAAIVQDTGAEVIPPYDDWRIIAGQGTAALELQDTIPDLDYLLAPVGGGGLISGSALAVHALNPGLKVIGVEPKGADDAARSFQAGEVIPHPNPATIAEGLMATVGERNLAVMLRHLDEIVTVEETEIVETMRLVWERMKIIIESSSAVALAPLMTGKLKLEGRIGVILTGGNVDLDRLPWQAD